VLTSPVDAGRLGLQDGDVVRLTRDGAAVSGPDCIVPGHAAGCVTCHLGYGRKVGGQLAPGLGFSAYPLLTSKAGGSPRVTMAATGERIQLARTQEHFTIDGREIVQFSGSRDAPPAASGHGPPLLHELPTLLPEEDWTGPQWGMSIDLSRCVGCNACVVACQSENNVPIVGREGVIASREMHWLRLDLYYTGPPEDPVATHQPMLCQHCEKAPCELVCPVAATTHSSEGLNQMTYNRCIGTRYCSNNCPYKVRRFNFFEYTNPAPVLSLMRNPEVTVRSRGVMEKCTFCVQRINHARVDAKTSTGEAEPHIADGAVQTACQQACPAQAIVFGDVADPSSRVSQLKASPRNYAVLGELNTQPRTTYLSRWRNLNPELDAGGRG
jgi:molybdopterin-containing oxidoreductase family iron-sulfur binding subunit